MISKTFDAFITHSSRYATAAVAIKAHLLSVDPVFTKTLQSEIR